LLYFVLSFYTASNAYLYKDNGLSDSLLQLATARTSGTPFGIYSVCSAHSLVIQAAVEQALQDDSVLLVEATCNQVNQFGGYTGMKPPDFLNFVSGIAGRLGLSSQKLILGGDHLGPSPWQHLPAQEAMQYAEDMVIAYARAGFTKVHLDTSMSCSDDDSPLPEWLVAKRAARLGAAAEASTRGQSICYVIGTEVPPPGGTTESLEHMVVTSPESVDQTLRVHREAFHAAGLGAVWPRVIAAVVQPGVEFNHTSVADYAPERTLQLQRALDDKPTLVYEAHSTDYQRPDCYRRLVRDGFAILKVGPALTFAMREALFALAAIEEELVGNKQCSMLPAVVEEVMLNKPQYWNSHYHGDTRAQYLLRRYSYSDRIRYYWADPIVRQAVATLFLNLDTAGIPKNMLSQHLPEQYAAVRNREIPLNAERITLHKIQAVLGQYANGCRRQDRVA
jgi:D-tagatose-1,6-bisphosphate aldolase subunit GatZ/KbaZ